MNLINEKVVHKSFGVGTIKALEQSIMIVDFYQEDGEKSFIFPDAFEKFLKLDNLAIEKDVFEQIRLKKEEIELEKGKKILVIIEEEEQRKKEKLELAKEKKKAAKKPAVKNKLMIK